MICSVFKFKIFIFSFLLFYIYNNRFLSIGCSSSKSTTDFFPIGNNMNLCLAICRQYDPDPLTPIILFLSLWLSFFWVWKVIGNQVIAMNSLGFFCILQGAREPHWPVKGISISFFPSPLGLLIFPLLLLHSNLPPEMFLKLICWFLLYQCKEI